MCELVWDQLGKVLKKSWVRIKHPPYEFRFLVHLCFYPPLSRVRPKRAGAGVNLSFAGLVGKVGRHTPRLLVNEWVGERGTAGGRGLGRPFDFERAHAHSNDVLYQVSPPVTLIHTLPLPYPYFTPHAVSL